MGRDTLFLDDGGVMNDNALRAPQWQQLVGEFFTPRYYEHIFADLGIEPSQALIVDDRPDCIDQAARLGAHTVLIGPKAPEKYRPDLQLASLAELPDQMHHFD